MKAQAVPSFLVDGKWLNFFCRTMKELGSSFPSLVLTRFFALMHPPYHSLQPSERLKSERFLPD